jgi:hypothetical protein
MGRPASFRGSRAGIVAARRLVGDHAALWAVYINLDVGMHEAPLAEPLPSLDTARFVPKLTPALPDPAQVTQAAALLHGKRSAGPTLR